MKKYYYLLLILLLNTMNVFAQEKETLVVLTQQQVEELYREMIQEIEHIDAEAITVRNTKKRVDWDTYKVHHKQAFSEITDMTDLEKKYAAFSYGFVKLQGNPLKLDAVIPLTKENFEERELHTLNGAIEQLIHKDAQTDWPILRTNSENISIKEGTILHDNVWGIAPELALDVFVTNKFQGKKTIQFISDIDTISFEVVSDQQYNFKVLWNGKEAHTQINTSTKEPPSIKILSYTKNGQISQQPDVIPFTIGADHRLHVSGTINGSEPLDFLFDTGANGIALAANVLKDRVALKTDGTTENEGSDGIATIPTSSNNTMDIDVFHWEEVPLLIIDYKSRSFDGVLGWNAFYGKIIEIDYNRNVLVIHHSPETIPTGYTKMDMKMIGGVPYIQGTLVVGDKAVTEWLEYDTGSDWTLGVSQAFARKHGLNGTMKRIGGSKSSGSTGIWFKNDDVLLPKLKLSGFEMTDMPMSIAQVDPEGITDNEVMGNLLLKRFNAIIDFQNNQVYLKPNALMGMPYEK